MEFLSTSALTAAGVVLLVQQILKLNIVPIAFANRYPVPTNLILSLIATVVIVNPSNIVNHVPAFLVQWFVVGVVAAIGFNQLLGKWTQLRAAEGEGK